MIEHYIETKKITCNAAMFLIYDNKRGKLIKWITLSIEL